MTNPAIDSLPTRLLRVSCTAAVAVAFLAAGAGKILHRDAGVTILARYAPSPRAVAAVGCFEVALALWLLSFRFPRWAAAAAIAALLAFSVLIGAELRRTEPLPCGCMPLIPGATDPHAVRRGLWLALGRNGFLILLGATGMVLSDPRPEASGVSL